MLPVALKLVTKKTFFHPSNFESIKTQTNKTKKIKGIRIRSKMPVKKLVMRFMDRKLIILVVELPSPASYNTAN